MRKMFLRITVGGVTGVAVLFALILLWTRALELLNARSDLSVAIGAVLLVATPVIAITLVYYGVRRILIAGARDEDHARAEAQATANERLTRSLTPQLVQYEALQKWDGKLPQMTGSGAVPFIQIPSGK